MANEKELVKQGNTPEQPVAQLTDRSYFELCYDQYNREMDNADSLYQRSSATIFSLPILFAAFYTLGRTDLLSKWSSRPDILIYHLTCGAALLLLLSSTIALVLAICPRANYKSLASMNVWKDWREQYEKYLEKQHAEGSLPDPAALEQAMIENICPRLAEAQTVNADINEQRRKYWRLSILFSVVAMIAIGLEAAFNFVLRIQGI